MYYYYITVLGSIIKLRSIKARFIYSFNKQNLNYNNYKIFQIYKIKSYY